MIQEMSPTVMPALEDLCMRTIAMPAHTNANGDMFGGWILSQMDMAGGNLAARYAHGKVATVAIDAITFLSPIFVGDEVSCYAKLLKLGKTSIRLKVETWARGRFGFEVRKVTEGIFTFVSIDENRRPTPLPPL